jgi:hypothetical protein
VLAKQGVKVIVAVVHQRCRSPDLLGYVLLAGQCGTGRHNFLLIISYVSIYHQLPTPSTAMALQIVLKLKMIWLLLFWRWYLSIDHTARRTTRAIASC